MNRLLDSGLKVVETGSFVRPDRVPQVGPRDCSLDLHARLIIQMADTATLLPRLRPITPEGQDVYYPVLVPNMRGLENLFKLEDENRNAGRPPLTNEIAIFVAASDVGPIH